MSRELVRYRATQDIDDAPVEAQVREVRGQRLEALASLGTPGLIVVLTLLLLVVVPLSLVMHDHWHAIDGSLFGLVQFVIYLLYGVALVLFIVVCALAWRFVQRKPMRVVRHKPGAPVAGIEIGNEVIQPENYHPRPFSQVRSVSISNTRQAADRLEEAEEQDLLPEPQGLRSVTFREVASQIPSGQQLLGVRADGSLRLGTLEADKLTTLYIGKSRTGKTVSAAGELGIEVRNGALLMVADPHEHKPDSLAKKIGSLGRFLFPGTGLASRPEDILSMIQFARAEMARRRGGGAYDRDLIVVIEEYGLLFDDPDVKPELLALSKELTREGRGFRMYGKFLTQQMSGGMSSQVRRLAASYVIHRIDYADAFAILRDSDLAKQAMQLAPGSSIVVDASGERELLQQPYITPEDVHLLAQQAPRPALMYQDYARQYQMTGSDEPTNVYPQLAQTQPTSFAVPPMPMKTGRTLAREDVLGTGPLVPVDEEPPVVSRSFSRAPEPAKMAQIVENQPISPVREREKMEREQILALYRQGQKPYQIAGAMGKGSYYTARVKQVIEEEEARLAAQEASA